MKIVAISDTHSFHERYKVPDGDVFIHAGDFCNWGKIEEVIKFAMWVQSLPHRHKLILPGNHDMAVERDLSTCKAIFAERGSRLLVDEEVEIDGIKFFFSPWTPFFGNWAFMRKDMRHVWDRIPEGTDVLVTHGPPVGILDENSWGESIGCKYLLEAVKLIKPKYHFFGHCHEQGGKVVFMGNTTFRNVAVNDRNDTATEIVIE